MAFTAYDAVTEPILDPSYGKIIFNSFSWGFGSEIQAERKQIKTHQCEREELGLEDQTSDKDAFYKVDANSQKSVRKYAEKFLCIDKKDMYISGSYNSDKARLMNIQLVRCSEEDEEELGIKCKSSEEITTFMRNKFFLMLYNQRRFEP